MTRPKLFKELSQESSIFLCTWKGKGLTFLRIYLCYHAIVREVPSFLLFLVKKYIFRQHTTCIPVSFYMPNVFTYVLKQLKLLTSKIKLIKETKHMVLFPRSSGASLVRLIRKKKKKNSRLKHSWVQNSFGKSTSRKMFSFCSKHSYLKKTHIS